MRMSPAHWAWLVLAALLLVANVVRFVHLDADFPPGLTTSRALYTDEGLYSANAVNLSAGRSWYIPGELNAMINLPVVPVLQAGVFRLFGHSLIVARSLVAAISIILIGAAFLLTVRHSSPLPAGLVAVTLSLDFFLFSYSRLAILDVIMTAVVTLTFVTASFARAKNIAVAAGLAGTLLGVAALTKTTALCSLPALAYFCVAGVPDPRRQRQIAGLVLGSCALVLIGYNALAWYAYPGDYLYFHQSAEVRLAAGPLDLARNFALAAFNTVRVDPSVAVMALASTAVMFKSSAAFRANVLVRTSAIWVWAFLVMLSITSYQPSRYFVVVLVPLVILLAVAIGHVLEVFPTRRSVATISAVLVGCLLTYNAIRIANYLRHPVYSFARMAREVGEIVNGASASQRPGVLLGTMAPSVSLESDVSAISPEYATQDLTTRIATRCPTYFIALHGSGAGDDRVLSTYYEVEPIKEWSVFKNYFEHRPVRLSRLRPRTGFLPACTP
jgi:4-amino-4-deoxy-L-arabinose transferase-like glycosyltransferase